VGRAAEGQIKELLRRIIEAQEIERKRIARDLHDNLGQQLTGLRINLEVLRKDVEAQPELCGKIDKTQEIASSIEAEVDFIAWEMRPAALDHLGLAKALDNFAREWAKHYGIPIEFSDVGLGDSRLGPEVEINLYRITQEALNNVMKHAGASRVGVLLERRDGHVVLIVEDDGRGFEPGRAVDGEKGMGLLSMRERALQVGGALEIESEPGAGTTIYARVPAGRTDAGMWK
jgi:signal transduction histidine kinase